MFSIPHVRDRFIHRLFAGALGALLLSGLLSQPQAWALEKISTTESVNKALTYGLKNQGQGYTALLGPNWIEGENGELLNVYSPFMMLAAKTYSDKSIPQDATKEDLKKARQRYGGLISKITDPKKAPWVKFSVAVYGPAPMFAAQMTSSIEGIGHGKTFTLKPDKEILDKRATLVGSVGDPTAYEGINSYYYDFSKLEPMEEYRLILKRPGEKPLEFHIKNAQIY